jgi:hypothetical protein
VLLKVAIKQSKAIKKPAWCGLWGVSMNKKLSAWACGAKALAYLECAEHLSRVGDHPPGVEHARAALAANMLRQAKRWQKLADQRFAVGRSSSWRGLANQGICFEATGAGG